MLRAFLIFGVVALARAQIPSIGFCPDYLPMSDFDIDNFLGKWYETERYFQFTDPISRCVVTDYAKGPSGKIYVSNEVTNRLTGIKRLIDGQLELAGRVGEGKLNVRYSTTPLSSQATLTVLDTDYDNYAVIWSCSGFGLLHAQSAWVMTRERLPAGPVLQKVYGVLDKFKISRSFFVKTDQEGCAVAASDINAANGITAQSTVAQATGLPQRTVPLLEVGGGEAQEAIAPSEAVKSVEINSENFKSVEDIPSPVIPEAAVVEVILPEAVNSISSQQVNTEVINSVGVATADAASEAVKSLLTSIEADKTDVSQNKVDLEPIAPESDGIELKPVQVAEVILENNNSGQQTEPQLKSEINLIETIVPENLPVPAVPQMPQVIVEEVYVPLKTVVEEKVTFIESKTN